MNDATTQLDLLAIKPPLDLDPGDGTGPLWWVLAVLLIAGAALLWWGCRRPIKPPTPPAPDAVAQRKLREAWNLLGTPALFAEAVADILRVYLEERFKAHAPERTTEEFLNELQQMPQMTGEQKELLGQFLKFCDFPKFAQLDPSEEECRRLHGIAVKLVQETAPARPGSAPPQIVPTKIS